ncbi:MAG: rhamnulokinase [Thermoleophilia bacterium]
MVAVDLGAQSGRVAVARLEDGRLSLCEVHRFANAPVRAGGTLYWDILALYGGVIQGLRRAAGETDGRVESVGVDTWGVDFALLDRAGRLLGNPVHHRDGRSARGMAYALSRFPARALYERTGIQLMPINTLFQLAAMAEAGDPTLDAARTFLLVPDLLHYWLCGEVGCERTNATTTACLDLRQGAWARDLLAALGIPAAIFPQLVPPGARLGPLREDVAEETRLDRAEVVAPATHDTASAVAAVPFRQQGSAYVSAGTWSLVGVERLQPAIDERTFAANLTNEGGVGGTVRLLRNVTGLWLLHECRRTWAEEGREWGYEELLALAEEAAPLRSLVDPDHPSFVPPGDMPARIRSFCAATGQPVPETPGEVVRCALESVILGQRRALELLRAAAGADPAEVHVVGGGARNRLLCQWTADAAGLPVLAGPEEATLVGNACVQAMGLGELTSLAEAREVVRLSFPPLVYEPGAQDPWDDAYGRLQEMSSSPEAAEAGKA